MHASATLGEIAGRLGGELTGDPATAHRCGRAARVGELLDDRLPRQPPLREAAGELAGRLRHRRSGVQGGGAGAWRRDRHARSLPLLRPPHPVVGRADTAAARARSASLGGRRSQRGDRRRRVDRPVRRGRGGGGHRRRRHDRCARLRRPRLPARRGHPARAAGDADVRDDPRRALLHPVRRGHRRRRLRLRAERRALGEDRAARPGAASATTSRSAPTPASTAAPRATP